jgi:hypothetical protein
MAFEFLTDLQEARLTRGRNNQRELTYKDCKEKAYLLLLMLETLRHYRSYRSDAAKYANKTVIHRDYQRFRIDSTDLYNMFYFITGDKVALGKLKNPGDAEKQRKTTVLSVGKLNGYLRNIVDMKPTTNADYQALMAVEADLKITNSQYKEVRRRLASFDTATPQERQQIATRLMFAARAKLSDSDLIPLFSKLVADKNLEDYNATSPEPEVSISDAGDIAGVMNYKFLLSTTRLPFINQFMEKASKGMSIPAHLVASYYPILKMVHEIVQAGPSYVEQLKQVHNRAKNTRIK